MFAYNFRRPITRHLILKDKNLSQSGPSAHQQGATIHFHYIFLWVCGTRNLTLVANFLFLCVPSPLLSVRSCNCALTRHRISKMFFAFIIRHIASHLKSVFPPPLNLFCTHNPNPLYIFFTIVHHTFSNSKFKR